MYYLQGIRQEKCGEMMTEETKKGKHRDPLNRRESHFKKTEPEVMGVPLSKVVRAKKDARPEEDS